MPEPTLNGVLTSLTDVLKALTTNEAVFVRQLRQLRSQPRSDRPSASSTMAASQPRPFDPPSHTAGTNGTAVPEHDLTRPMQFAARPPTNWPTDSGEDPLATTNEKRDYNYFSELDEKLADLQQSSSERRSV